MLANLCQIAAGTLRYRLFGTRTPLVLSLSVTGRCNLRCIYCYSEADNRHAANVPTRELLEIIDGFHTLGTRIFMLQGGEPLLHPDIGAIIAHIKAKRAYCSVTTNGVFIPQHLEALKKVDQLQLSIDGNQETTDANRGAGVYDHLIEGMELCRRNRIPFHLHTVLTSRSTPDNTLEPLQQLAAEYGTHLNFCIPARTGSALDATMATNKQIHDLYQLILERKQHGTLTTNNTEQGLRDIIDWTAVRDYDSVIPSGDPTQAGHYPKCIMGDLVAWLDSTGMLYPCAIRFGQEGFAHSIHEHGIRGAWERLQKRPCHYCTGSSEFNNLFRLNPAAVLNSLKFLFSGGRKDTR